MAEEDSYYTVAINNGRRVLEVLRKPVADIIRDKLNPLLESCATDISVITVIGHSLNKIDLPYFSSIFFVVFKVAFIYFPNLNTIKNYTFNAMSNYFLSKSFGFV